MTFDQWYADQGEWYKDPEDKLRDLWRDLEMAGLDPATIAITFDTLCIVMRAEYGE